MSPKVVITEVNEEKYYVKKKEGPEGITNWREYCILFKEIAQFLETVFVDGATVNITIKTDQNGNFLKLTIHTSSE